MGSHVVRTWSSTQAVIALSSGEAEYYGMVKGSSLAMGMRSMCRDFGVELGIVLHTDASAAVGIANRTGLGKVRHIEVNQLWLQSKVRDGIVVIKKVDGEKNLSDALTKHVDGKKLEWHVKELGGEVRRGRHPLMPEVGSKSEGEVLGSLQKMM